jgi:hypothetical protein
MARGIDKGRTTPKIDMAGGIDKGRIYQRYR